MVAKPKGAVRAEHLGSMAKEDHIPKWALGLELAPAYVSNNPEAKQKFSNLVRSQAKERMLLVTESLDKKAKYFRNIDHDGIKANKQPYGGNKCGIHDCKGIWISWK